MEFGKEISKLGYKYKNGASRILFFVACYEPKVGLLRKNPDCLKYFEVLTDVTGEVPRYTVSFNNRQGKLVQIEGLGDETLQKALDAIHELNEGA